MSHDTKIIRHETPDATTCFGCLANATGTRHCLELLNRGVCQKQVHERTTMALIIERILVAGIVHHNEPQAVEAVRMLAGVALLPVEEK